MQLRRLQPALLGNEVHYATVSADYRSDVGADSFHCIPDATRWNKVKLVWLSLRIGWLIIRIRPHVVLTTGAAPGWMAIVIGRFAGARTIWIDSIANAERMSMSGESVRRFADVWLTQWPGLAEDGGAEYAGAVM